LKLVKNAERRHLDGNAAPRGVKQVSIFFQLENKQDIRAVLNAAASKRRRFDGVNFKH